MPQYLLSTQSLVDIATRNGSASEQWLAHANAYDPAIYDTDIFISAVSHALIGRLLERMPHDADREALRQATDALVDRFVGRGQVVDVTKGIADVWGVLIGMTLTYTTDDDTEGQYPSGEKLVMATAIKGTEGLPRPRPTSAGIFRISTCFRSARQRDAKARPSRRLVLRPRESWLEHRAKARLRRFFDT